MKNYFVLSKKFLVLFFCWSFVHFAFSENTQTSQEKIYQAIIPMVKNPDSEEETSVQFDGNVCSHNPKMNLLLGRLCSFDTRSDRPQIHVIYPDKCEVLAVLCQPNIFNLKPLRIFNVNWATKSRKTVDFNVRDKSGKNKSFLLGLEYKNRIPMWWKLKSMHDLKDLIFYLKEKFVEFGIEPIKTSVMITIESCSRNLPILATHKSTSCSILSKEESDFLNEYFTIIQDQSTINRMILINAQMLKVLGNTNLFQLKPNTESAISSFFGWIYSKVKVKDILLVILFYELFRMTRDFRAEVSKMLSDPGTLENLVVKIMEIIERKKGSRDLNFSKRSKSFFSKRPPAFSSSKTLGTPLIPTVTSPRV